jgi:hypothetical protein
MMRRIRVEDSEPRYIDSSIRLGRLLEFRPAGQWPIRPARDPMERNMRTFLISIGCLLSFAASAAQIDGSTGNIGEVIASHVPLASAVSLTRHTPTNITSVSLTPGDWTCFSSVQLNTGVSTVISILSAWVSTSSASIPAAFEAVGFARVYPPSTPGIIPSVNPTAVRFSLSATTTVYLEASSAFTTSTLAIYGSLSCRRAR